MPRPLGRLPRPILISHLRPKTVAPRPQPLASWEVAPAILDSSSLAPDSGSPSSTLPRPLGRLPPPASVASSPPSSRPQAVAPRPLWRLPPPASVASPPSSWPQKVAPCPLWSLPPPDTNPYSLDSLVFVIFSQGLLRFSPILSFRKF